MIFEFMTIDTPLPPCMAFPRALTGFPVSSTCLLYTSQRSRERDEKGRLRGTDYIIYEQPPNLDLPTLENPTLGRCV